MTDTTLQQKIEVTKSFIWTFNRSKSGKYFFKALAEYFGKSPGMDYVCIDRMTEQRLEAQTVADYFDAIPYAVIPCMAKDANPRKKLISYIPRYDDPEHYARPQY
jgi:hypothetical protein